MILSLVLPVALITFSLILINKFKKLVKIEYINHNEKITKSDNTPNKKNILLTCTEIGFGGREVATINLYKCLIQSSFHVTFLIAKNSALEKKLNKEKISYYKCFTQKILGMHWFFGQSKQLRKLLQQNNIEIIHINSWKETFICKAANKKLNLPIFLTQHDRCRIKPYVIDNLSGIFAVNKELVEIAESVKRQNNLKIGFIDFLPPFYDPKPFLNFTPSNKKRGFFKENFNIDIQNVPTICCIANVCKTKNQTLLLQAMHELIYKKNNPVQVIFAGRYDGKIKEECDKLITELKLENFAKFIGFSDKIPEIIYHSNISVLPCKEEAFGIVYLEAALMKKPIITSKNAGSKNVIIPNKTGLFFDIDNVDNLVDKIELCISNNEFRENLGEKAFNHVIENFLPSKTIQKLESLYKNSQA